MECQFKESCQTPDTWPMTLFGILTCLCLFLAWSIHKLYNHINLKTEIFFTCPIQIQMHFKLYLSYTLYIHTQLKEGQSYSSTTKWTSTLKCLRANKLIKACMQYTSNIYMKNWNKYIYKLISILQYIFFFFLLSTNRRISLKTIRPHECFRHAWCSV